jgi:outer membrane lipoprotein SlyB
MRRFITAVSLSAIVLVAGCAKNIDPNVYTESSVGQVSDTYQGMVLSVRDVTVQSGDKLTDNGWGMVLGGGAGALAGSQVGQGLGNTAAVVGGAVIVGALGALAQGELSKQPAVEYIVKYWDVENIGTVTTTGEDEFDRPDGKKSSKSYSKQKSTNRANERVITLVQGVNPRLEIGQKVFILITSNGRSRLVADNSGIQQLNQPVINAATPKTR